MTRLDPQGAMTKAHIDTLIRAFQRDGDFPIRVANEGYQIEPSPIQLGNTDQWFLAFEFTSKSHAPSDTATPFCQADALPWKFRKIIPTAVSVAQLDGIKESLLTRFDGFDRVMVPLMEAFTLEDLYLFPEQVRAWMPACGYLQDDTGMQFYPWDAPTYDSQGYPAGSGLIQPGQLVEDAIFEATKPLVFVDAHEWVNHDDEHQFSEALLEYQMGPAQQIRPGVHAYALQGKHQNLALMRQVHKLSSLIVFSVHGSVHTRRIGTANDSKDTAVVLTPMISKSVFAAREVESAMQMDWNQLHGEDGGVAPLFLRSQFALADTSINLGQLQVGLQDACAQQIGELAGHGFSVQVESIPEVGTGLVVPMVSMVYNPAPTTGTKIATTATLARWGLRSVLPINLHQDDIATFMRATLDRMVQIAPAFVAWSEVFGSLDADWKLQSIRGLLPKHRRVLCDTSGIELVLHDLSVPNAAPTPYAVDTICVGQPMEVRMTQWVESFHANVKAALPLPSRRFVDQIRHNIPNKSRHAFQIGYSGHAVTGTWKYVSRQRRTKVLVTGTFSVDLPTLNPHEGNYAYGGSWRHPFEFLIDGAWFRWDTTKWKSPEEIAIPGLAGDLQWQQALAASQAKARNLAIDINTQLATRYADGFSAFREDGICEVRAFVAMDDSSMRLRSPGFLFYVNPPGGLKFDSPYRSPLNQWALFWEVKAIKSVESLQQVMDSVLRRLPKIRHTLLRLHNLFGDCTSPKHKSVIKALFASVAGSLVDRSGMGLVVGAGVTESTIDFLDYWSVPISGSVENSLARWCDSVEKCKLLNTPKPTTEFLDSLAFDTKGNWMGLWMGKSKSGKWAYEFIEGKPHLVLAFDFAWGLPSMDMTVSHRVSHVASWKSNSTLVIDSERLFGSKDALSVLLAMNLPIYAPVDTTDKSDFVEVTDSDIFALN